MSPLERHPSQFEEGLTMVGRIRRRNTSRALELSSASRPGRRSTSSWYDTAGLLFTRPGLEGLEPRLVLSGLHDEALVSALAGHLDAADPQAFPRWTEQLTASHLLGTALPLLGSRLATQYSPSAALGELLSQLEGPYATLSDLRTALAGIPNVDVLGQTDLPDNLELQLRFQHTASLSIPLNADFDQLSLHLDATLELAAGLDFRLTVGSYWDAASSQAIPYVGTADDQLHISIEVTGSSAASGARLGFLDITLADVTASFAVGLDLDLTDPNVHVEDQRITPFELSGSTFVVPHLQVEADAELSLIFSSSFTPNATLTLGWPDVSAPTTVVSNLPQLGSIYESFERLTNADFSTAFSDISAWTGLLNHVAVLGRPLPVIGTQVAELLDVGNRLESLLVDKTGHFVSVETLLSRLRSVPEFSQAEVTFANDVLRYTAQVSAEIEEAIELQLLLPDIPLLALSSEDLNLRIQWTGQITVGVDLSGTTPVFFLGADDEESFFDIQAEVNLPDFGARGGVGFVEVVVAGGSAHLAAGAGLALKSSEGRITIADMGAGLATLSNYVDLDLQGSADLTLPVSVPLLNLPEQTLTVQWPQIADISSMTFTGAELFDQLLNYADITADSLSLGLGQLGHILERIPFDSLGGTNPLHFEIPVLNRSLGELIDLASYFEDTLTHAAGAAAGEAPFQSTGELLELLQGLPGLENIVAAAAAVDDGIQFDLSFAKALHEELPFDLQLGSAVNLKTEGQVTADLATQFALGWGVSSNNEFFLVESAQQPLFQADLSVSADVDAAAQLGFLDISIDGGTVALDGQLTLRLDDPETDNPATPGRISVAELRAANILNLVDLQFDWQGATVVLPLSTSLFDDTATMTIAWPELDAAPEINTDELQSFLRFNDITAEGVLAGLQKLPDVLSRLTGDNALGANLQFIGSTLVDTIRLGAEALDWLADLGDIGSVQRLGQELERVLNLDPGSLLIDVLPDHVEFAPHFRQEILDAGAHFAVDQPVDIAGSAIGLSVQGDALVTGMLDAGIAFGIDFEAASNEERFYIVPAKSQATVEFAAAADLAATLNLGLASLDVSVEAAASGSAADNRASLTVGLQDPGPDLDGRITLKELLDNPTDIFQGFTGQGEAVARLELPQLPGMSESPELTLTWADILDPASLQLDGVESLESYLDFEFNIGTALAGINSLIGMIEGWAGVDILNTRIPLVNKSLGDLFDFVGEIAGVFFAVKSASPETAAAFDQAVINAGSRVGVTITPHAEPQFHDPSNNRFHYTVVYRYEMELGHFELDFGGRPVLSFEGRLVPQLELDARLEFGLNPTDGFYLVDTGAAPELKALVTLDNSWVKVGGYFGPLQYGVSQGSVAATLEVGVDLVDPSGVGGRITASELAGNFTTVVDPYFHGNANLDFPIGVRIGDDGPGFTTRFSAGWESQRPTDFDIEFGDIHFLMGEFIGKAIGPYVQYVQQYNPLPAELLDFLRQEIPVINKTPLDIMGLPAELDLLLEIAALVNKIPDPGTPPSIDLSEYFAEDPVPGAQPGAADGAPTPEDDGFLAELKPYDITLPVFDSDGDGSFDTGSLIQVLMGEDVPLIRWNPERMFEGWADAYRYPFFSYGIPGIAEISASAYLEASLGIFADLDIGLSTRGLTDGDLLAGFFIGDNRPAAPNQPDDFEVGFEARVEVGISGSASLFGFDIVKVSGGAGVRGAIGLDVADVQMDASHPEGWRRVGRTGTGGDNRAHLDEIESITSIYGAHCALTVGGQIDVYARIKGKVDTPFGSFTLFDESTSFPFVDWEWPCDFEKQTLADVVDNRLVMRSDIAHVGDTLAVPGIHFEKPPQYLDSLINEDQSYVEGTIEEIREGGWVVLGDVTQYFAVVPALDYLSTDIPGSIVVRDPRQDADQKSSTSVTVWRDADSQPLGLRILRQQRSGMAYDEFTFAQLQGVSHLIVEGTAGHDTITIEQDVTVELPIEQITVNSWYGDDTVTFGIIDSTSGVSHLVSTTVNLGMGNDRVSGTPLVDRLYGDSGNDQLNGAEGDDLIFGGPGNDAIYAGAGDDEVYGEEGADRILGGRGNNTLYGGQDDDEIYGDEDRDTIHGDDGGDFIVGGRGPDVLHGDAGADTIYGGEDDDLLVGGAGQDTLYAEAGQDTVYGGDDRDKIYGGPGDDLLHGELGADSIYGGAGNDSLFGHDDPDMLYGGAGQDDLHGGPEADVLHGGVGEDEVYGDDGDDRIYGDNDDDNLFGGDGDDLIYGGGGQDVVRGDLGDDEIWGEDARDLLRGGPGNDTLHGGQDVDIIHGDDGDDVLFGDEDDDNLYGDDGNDRLFGGDDHDHLYGNEGADELHGEFGNDTLEGGPGNDTAYGESGYDVIIGGAGDDQLFGGPAWDRLYGGTGNDELSGGEDGDTLYGELGDDWLSGDAGDDQLYGGYGVDQLYGGDHNDLLVAGYGVGNLLDGGDGDDRIFGADEGGVDDDFNDTVYYGDIVRGGPGRDLIWGLGGSDYLQGDAGDDVIDTGVGVDYVSGGAGSDTIYAWGSDNQLFGDEGDDHIYGSDTGRDLIHGGADNDHVEAQGGPDEVYGDSGQDSLDGGSGTDAVYGGDDDDVLYGGGGAGDRLYGEAGNDVLYGSDDGADDAYGGPGNDRLIGLGGNDRLSGGFGDDIILGGPGDDQLSGDEGSDLLLGGADHDILYGHNTQTVDDQRVDYLYGDFGTEENEPESGQDQLFGGAGNDRLYGEDGDDLIVSGPGTDDQIFYGGGESANPDDFTPPPPTSDPPLEDRPALSRALSTLATGVVDRGHWSELGGSASQRGVSGDPGISFEPDVAVTADRQYVAWVDSRNGNFEIYAAQFSGGQWHELGGSAHGGGISNSEGTSRQPSLTLDASGQPLIAWTESSASGTDILVAAFDPTANAGQGDWVALGSSLAAGGISQTGAAAQPHVVQTPAGPVVIWVDATSGNAEVYASRYSGGSWQPLGEMPISQAGADGLLRDLAVATEGNRLAIAWSQVADGTTQVYAKEYTAGSWSELDQSATGPGISNTPLDSRHPTLAFHDSQLFVAWQDRSNGRWEVYARRHGPEAGWQDAGAMSAIDGGVSERHGAATMPQLAAGGGQLQLFWADDLVQARTGERGVIYAMQWQGDAFAEHPLDAAYDGISHTGSLAETLAAAVDASGHAYLAWSDITDDGPEVLLRGNLTAFQDPLYQTDAVTSVHDILQQNDLGPGDVIFVKDDQVTGFTVTADDAGVTIIGKPGISVGGPITIDQSDGVTIQRLELNDNLLVVQGDRFTLRESVVHAGTVVIDAGSGVHLSHNLLALQDGLTLTGNTAAAVIEFNTLQGSTALEISGDGAGTVDVRANTMMATDVGIALLAAADGQITDNRISTSASQGVGVQLHAPFAGLIEANDVSGGHTGLDYAAAAEIRNNRFHDSLFGAAVTVDSDSAGLGFVGDSRNEFFDNVYGVQLDGRMQNQAIFNNDIGVTGAGILGGATLEQANLIQRNVVGVDFAGTIQFNRIAGNQYAGIRALNNQLITHNLIYRNAGAGVYVAGKEDVRIVHNTLYAPQGDNLRIEQASSNVEVRSNILWSEAGYDIYVADDSSEGFFSDFNNLHASGTGQLVHWTKDFGDLLDWQEDVHQFDLHSQGRTDPNPLYSRPHFMSLADDDFRTFDVAARQRGSNPSQDAADPRTDLGLPPDLQSRNLLTNPGFEEHLDGWSVNTDGRLQSTNPPPFAGDSYFAAGVTELGYAEQTIDLLAAGYTAEDLDAQDLVIAFGGRVRAGVEEQSDSGQIQLILLDGDGNEVDQLNYFAANITERWELLGDRANLPPGVRQLQFRFEATRSLPTGTNDSYVDHTFVYVLNEAVSPDLGAYGNTDLDALATTPHIGLRFPDLYTDWELEQPRDIRWQTFGNADDAEVQILLYQDSASDQGPEFLAEIATVLDTGTYRWIPQNTTGLTHGMYGLRIHVQLVDMPSVFDRSVETFTIPENSAEFFVNDAAGPRDEHTTTAGDNRHTGRIASAPKPYPNNVLRIYSLEPGDHLYIDDGDYALLYPLVVSAGSTRGDDEGFRVSGPGGALSQATLSHANPFTVAPVMELDDADYITLSHLALVGGQQGLYIGNQSTDFSGSDLWLRQNRSHGIQVDDTSAATSLRRLHALDNSGHGIRVEGLLGELADSVAGHNALGGIYLHGSGDAVIEHNESYQNGGPGIYVLNDVIGTTTIVGNLELSLQRGNLVHDNNGEGIHVRQGAQVAGNTVFGHTNTGSAGIVLISGGAARRNVVHGNLRGIVGNNSLIAENRIYDHTGAGIVGRGATEARHNVIYSNSIGVDLAAQSNASHVAHNVLYANSDFAIQLTQSAGTQIDGNTILQSTGSGIRIVRSNNVALHNNVVHVAAGFALEVAPDSQVGFASDYNLLHTTGTGQVARWQEVARRDLLEWRVTAFTDQHSLAADPLFVDPDGADDLLGYGGAQNDGRDDDLHLQSQQGSRHGSVLAPVASVATGLPDWIEGVWVNDTAQSPALDRGDPTAAFDQEPYFNGGYLNLGAYGNTELASKSPLNYVLVTRPEDGDSFPAGRTLDVTWRAHDVAGTVDVALFERDGGDLILVREIADDAPNSGHYAWTVPDDIPIADNYVVVVSYEGTDGTSLGEFRIGAATNVFYVNDGTWEPGDWTTKAGEPTYDGSSPDQPISSLGALLAARSFGPDDTILVDAGMYSVDSNLTLTADDSGVTIRGYHDQAYPDRHAVLNRGDVGSGSYVIELSGADDVTLEQLHITGGDVGVYAGYNVDSDRVSIVNSEVFGNDTYGIYFEVSNNHATITGSTFYGLGTPASDQPTAIDVDSNNVHINGNRIFDSATRGINLTAYSGRVDGNEIFDCGTGITVGQGGDGALIRGNTVYDCDIGITATPSATVTENHAYRHQDTAIRAIQSTAQRNDVHDSGTGMYVGSGGRAIDNRIYDNTTGVSVTGDAYVSGNRVYSNTTGILSSPTVGHTGTIEHNVLFDQGSVGIDLPRANGTIVRHNTIYESQAHGVRVRSVGQNVVLRNNIISVQTGTAIVVANDSQRGFSSDYNVLHLPSNALGWWQRSFSERADWFYELGLDAHSLVVEDPQLVSPSGDDGDFHLLATSPAIDRGDPVSHYLEEPQPNGGRANVGAYGNTAEAAASPAPGQLVQLLAPNGWEKFEVAQAVDVHWRAAGLYDRQWVALVNAGGPAVDNWSEEGYRYGGDYSQSTTTAIDLTGVVEPAPAAVYQTYASAQFSTDQTVNFHLPVPNGSYQLRLHFAEPAFRYPNSRLFDIYVQDQLVADDYDIVAESGDRYTAVTEQYDVVAAGGAGIQLTLLSEESYAILSAIELTQAHLLGVSEPRAQLHLSTDDGSSWSLIAADLPMDRFGRGQFQWTAGPETDGNTARFKVTSQEIPTLEHTSDEPFLIANAGTYYYINDDSTEEDVFTLSTGDNEYSGKSPARPMASLRALMAAYDLDAGDTIQVDAGSYVLIHNAVLDSNDSGVQIVGPEAATALLDRHNPSQGSYVIQLDGADDVSLTRLSMTGGEAGIFAADNVDSDRLTVTESVIYGNDDYGIFLGSTNDQAVIASSTLYGLGATDNGQNTGLEIDGQRVRIANNTIFEAPTRGLHVTGYWGVVEGNEVFDCEVGIVAGSGSYGTSVRNNTVHDCNIGISAQPGVVVSENVSFRHTSRAIYVNGATAVGNEAYDSDIGVYMGTASEAVNNRIYDNATGVFATGDAAIRGNTIYSNNTGLLSTTGTAYQGIIEHNIFFDQRQVGLDLQNASGVTVAQNTIYEPAAIGVRVRSNARDVDLRNNIISVDTAAAIVVDRSGQQGFSSDYNVLHTPSGILGWWQREFHDHADWFYELGLDANSLVVEDPHFVAPLGSDGFLGWVDAGLEAAYYNNESLDGTPVLQRVDTDINFAWSGSPGSGITSDHFSVSWQGYLWVPTSGDYTFFSQANDGARFYLDHELIVDHWDTTGEFQFLANELPAGWHAIQYEMHDVVSLAQAVLSWQGPELSRQPIAQAYLSTQPTTPGDYSRDADFHLLDTSPAIDRGDPASYFLEEPQPSGGRVNAGAYGNTPAAARNPLAEQAVQLLSPNGWEKFEVGQQVDVHWRAAGLANRHWVGLVNAGGPTVDNWLVEQYRLGGDYVASTDHAIDLGGVSDPAPETVYRSYASARTADQVEFAFPVPDGSYQVRLHFAEPSYIAKDKRLFDIFLQGQRVADDYDIFAAAGARDAAVIESFDVLATGGDGILLELVSETSDALVAAIEISQSNRLGVPDPRVQLELSTDLGTSWLDVAAGLTMDRFGRGHYAWTAGPATSGNTALLRVTSQDVPALEHASDEPFLIAGTGPAYYVNDASLDDGEFTSAVGDNSNSGKSPDAPMRSLQALLAAYDLEPADTVYVDTGTYHVLHNVVLTAGDSGVTITGPSSTIALLNRANPYPGSYVVELAGANDVTLENLHVTGGDVGVYAGNVNSDRLRLLDNTIFANDVYGVSLAATNDEAMIDGNVVYGIPDSPNADEQRYGIEYYGSGTILDNNVVHSTSDVAIRARGPGSTISNNVINNNYCGIDVASSAYNTLIVGNRVHDNTSTGIRVNAYSVVRNNVLSGHNNDNQYAMTLNNGLALNNEVHGNYNGILVTDAQAAGNRVFNNRHYGLELRSDAAAYRNYVYSNTDVGIYAEGASTGFTGGLIGNLVYGNANDAIIIDFGKSPRVINNTVFQSVGRALQVENKSTNVQVRNNILWVQAGYDIDVAANSQSGFDSLYNLFYKSSASEANVGRWGTTSAHTLADWHQLSGQDFYTDNGDDLDDRSRFGDPLFVDRDGADNTLGYDPAGGGYDGGRDDNFYRLQFSPASDRADEWAAPQTDIEGHARHDDPGSDNWGGDGYATSGLGTSLFEVTGTAKGWRDDNRTWALALPFSFPFYESNYTTVNVSVDGLLHFSGPDSGASGENSTAELLRNRRIAPLWDELHTEGPGNDIYVDASVPDQVKILWDATSEADGGAVQFATTLFADGVIRFDYGAGNFNLSPTIGISRGNERHYLLSEYDGQAELNNSPSVQFLPRRDVHYTDIGAYEFRGSSLDTTPPRVTGTVPAEIDQGVPTHAPIREIGVLFNEPLNPIDARAPGNYELRGPGINGIIGDDDDDMYALLPSYQEGDNVVWLSVGSEPLPPGDYWLTVVGDASIHDLSGLALDGDGDGSPGGNYVQAQMTVVENRLPVANADGYALQEDEPLVVDADGGILPNDSDADGDPLTAFLVSPAAHGSVLLQKSGAFTYTPFDNYSGSDSFTYAVDDAHEGRATATVTLTVHPVNDAPWAVTLESRHVPELLPGAIVGRLWVHDPDPGDSHDFALSDSRFEVVDGYLKLKDDVALDFENQTAIPLELVVTDSQGASFTRSITIGCLDVNEAPTSVTLNHILVSEKQPGAVVGQLAVLDPDAGQSHQFAVSDTRFEVVDDWLKLRPNRQLEAADGPLVDLQITAIDSGTPPEMLTHSFTLGVLDEIIPWHNPFDRKDVNFDTFVTPIDVLIVINHLNANGPGRLETPPPAGSPPPFLDVNGDEFAAPVDVLIIINYLNALGEGEPEMASATERGGSDDAWLLAAWPLDVGNTTSEIASVSAAAEPRPRHALDHAVDWGIDWRQAVAGEAPSDERHAHGAVASSAVQACRPLTLDERLAEIESILSDIADDIGRTWTP